MILRLAPRALAALVVLVGVAVWAAPARAGDTWCVAGFEPGQDYGAETGAKTEQDSCSDSCFRGSGWHQHGFLKKDGKCYSCWDENDNTCETLAKDEGYELVSLASCSGVPIASPSSEPGSCYVDTPPQPQPQPQPQPDPPQTPPDDASKQPPPQDPPAPEPAAQVKPKPKPLPRPPAPKPTDYDGVIVKIAPGPYAVNTPIKMVGGAVTRAGKKKRRVARGDFVVIGADGKEVARVHGKPKGFHIVADVTLPVGGNVTIRFEPISIITGSGEKKRDVAFAEQALAAAACRVQAVLEAPTTGEILVADAATPLRGRFVDAAGQPAPVAALGGAKAVFVVETTGADGERVEQRLDAALDAAGVATAQVTVARPASASDVVRVGLVAEGGAGDVCPATAADARVTALGVGIEIKPVAARCYLDRPCKVTARFVLPADPAARALGEAFVRSAGLTMTAAAGGAPGDLTADRPGQLDAVWTGTVIPGDLGDVALVAAARSDRGLAEDQASLHVEEPIELKLTGPLDLGTVPAGTASNQRCATLDLSASRGVRYQQLRLSAPRPTGCDSYPVVFHADAGVGFPLHGDGGVTVEVGEARAITICLAEIPRCAAEAPAPVTLTVQAVNPDFPDQRAELAIQWRVSGRSLWACWWWLIAATGGALTVLVVGYGFVRPWRFAVDDQVQLAAKREQLARAVGRRLRDLPGGRPGWYRSAAVGLLDAGQATAKLGTALVELHARRGEIVLRSRGGLQRVSPQSKKLEPVPEAATKDGHVASKNVVYAAGNLFFQIK